VDDSFQKIPVEFIYVDEHNDIVVMETKGNAVGRSVLALSTEAPIVNLEIDPYLLYVWI
jgi:hypothetical protein